MGCEVLSCCREIVLAVRGVTGSSHVLTKVPTHLEHGQGSAPRHGERSFQHGGRSQWLPAAGPGCACATKLH